MSSNFYSLHLHTQQINQLVLHWANLRWNLCKSRIQNQPSPFSDMVIGMCWLMLRGSCNLNEHTIHTTRGFVVGRGSTWLEYNKIGGVNLYHLLLCYRSGIYNEDFTFFLWYQQGYGYLILVWFTIFFGSIYHAWNFIRKQSHCSIKTTQDGIDTKDNSGTQRFSHLHIPNKHWYLSGITIMISTWRFFDTIIDVD